MTRDDDRHIERRLQAYLDGVLDDREAEVVRAHCEHCEACRTALAELRAVHAMLARDETLAPPRPVWPGVRDRLSGRLRRPARRWGFAVGTAAAAVAGIVLGVVLGTLGPSTGASETQVDVAAGYGQSALSTSSGTLGDVYLGGPNATEDGTP